MHTTAAPCAPHNADVVVIDAEGNTSYYTFAGVPPQNATEVVTQVAWAVAVLESKETDGEVTPTEMYQDILSEYMFYTPAPL